MASSEVRTGACNCGKHALKLLMLFVVLCYRNRTLPAFGRPILPVQEVGSPSGVLVCYALRHATTPTRRGRSSTDHQLHGQFVMTTDHEVVCPLWRALRIECDGARVGE